MERLPDTYIPGLGQWPMALPEKVRLAGKATEDQVQGLLDQPMGTPLEEVGRALRAAVALGVENPLRVGKAAVESAGGLIGRGVEEVKRGFGVTPAPVKTAAPVVSPDRVPSTANPGSAAVPTETTTTTIPRPNSLRAVKDAAGRVTFTNFDHPDKQEIDYAAATAAMRPEGRQAGGVSSPVARDDQGRPTMTPDFDLERSRAQEVGDLSHKAVVQQLQDQGNPQAKVQRDVEAATQIANMFTPSEEEIASQIEIAFKTAVAARPDIPPDVLRQVIEQGVRAKIRDNRLSAVQEYLNKERYPGSTLSGYGGQLRGEAADITSR